MARPTEPSITSFPSSASAHQAQPSATGAGRGLLSLLEPLYAGAVAMRSRLYDSGWLRDHRLPVPVISVGNLTAGGSGKSPMVALIARTLAQHGSRPAVVSRGYRGTHGGQATIVSAGDGPLVPSLVGGDEPVMLASQLPGVPIIVARARKDGGALAVREFMAGCVILDDGFQHRALARDLNLLLVDGVDPFGNGRLLPAGTLREPIAAMARADALVITRADLAGGEPLAAIRQEAGRHCPRAAIFHARARPSDLIDLQDGKSVPLDRLRGQRVVCFAGIARPERFFQDVEASGAVVASAIPFPDHHRFSDQDLSALRKISVKEGAAWLLTTEKDAARRAMTRDLPGLHALRVTISVDEEPSFSSLLKRTVA